MNVKALNIKTLFFSICSSLIASLPLSAQAVIIDGTFKAKVANVESTEGLWGGIVGETLSGTFSYNTDLFESSALVEPDETRYFNNSNTFVNMTFNIAGNLFDISRDYTEVLNADSQTDIVIVRDGHSASSGTNHDYFLVLDSVYLGDDSSGYVRTTGEIYFFDQIADVISGRNLEQSFSWVGDGTDESGGYGSFYYNKGLNETFFFAFIHLHLTEVTASIRKTKVPEPTTLLLLTTALLGVALRYRNHA